MKIVILAAGLGTRLQHIVPDIPKVMIPLGGKPLLHHTIDRLKAGGFSEFVMNLHYFPEVITDYFGDGSKFGVNIEYSYEEELLESAGALKKMERYLTGDFAVVYGDMYFTVPLKAICDLREAHNAFGVTTVKHTTHVSQSDLLEVDPATGRMLRAHVRPHTVTEMRPGLFANVGLSAWSRKILEFIPAGKKVHLDKETVPRLLEAGKTLYTRPLAESEVAIDVGKPDNYVTVKALFGEQVHPVTLV